MALQARRTALLHPRLHSLDTLTFLRAASIATVAGTYPYNIPNNFAPPPYPYGPSIHYRRRDSGLYGVATIQHGNLVSEQNEHKSRRVWRPNVHNKKLWSNYLGRFVQVKVVTRVLRTIDKLGGLDEYLVGSDAPARIKELGVIGWALRWRVMQTRGYKERVSKERRALGLPERGWLVEEEERKREKRRQGMRLAEAYLEALRVEVEAGSKAVPKGVGDKDDRTSMNSMEENEAFSPEQEDAEQKTGQTLERYAAEAEGREFQGLEASNKGSGEARDSVESDFDVVEGLDKLEGHTPNHVFQSVRASMDPAVPDSTLPLPSEQLFTQLLAIAAHLRTTPDILINRARATIDNRATQIAAAAEHKAELAAERAALVSEIDTLLASSDVEPILNFHAKHIAIVRSENALQRERQGKSPLSSRQIKVSVTGPPPNIPADKWAELRARVKILEEDEPRRQQEAMERRARNARRKKFLENHREELIAKSERRRRNLSFLKKIVYEFRWIKKNGLMARFKRSRIFNMKSMWVSTKAFFRKRKSKFREERGKDSKD